MLRHARASSRHGYDPDGPVVMAPFRGSKVEKFPSQPEIKRSYQWVRHHPRPSRPSLGVMVKWRVAAPSSAARAGPAAGGAGPRATSTRAQSRLNLRKTYLKYVVDIWLFGVFWTALLIFSGPEIE
ncbi:hypothetical protein EVAR_86318_1 [Eumeta japonica]|uniref:Uncharacterized protein n=1 Tax=Eumeta variegata TaxID=151549 RepID=A0A4C1X341_EUMVA|nr:hypothetical protein EVAR_86318_1 [Eumeta japonica]